ncbi:MAG: hypothetical protein RBQ94_04910 [Methanimicrococcus sp.]|nr:hypothetical protein [Methanimicrococcus sp.]
MTTKESREPIEEQIFAPGFFIEGVAEILLQLKEDLYQVQKNLDASSEESRNEILRNRELFGTGIRPLWYTMPEIELTIKMEYVEREEKTIVNNIEKYVKRTRLVPIYGDTD